MSTMTISLPESLRAFVDHQVATAGYVRELIRRDQERFRMRTLLLEGAQSAPVGEADTAYFDALKAKVRKSSAGRRSPV